MSRLEEVEATWDHWGCVKTNTEVCGLALEQARTLAADVDARDEVIAEILAMLKPGEMPKYCSFDFQHKYRELYKEWQWKTALHARACEIAGRTE